MNPIIFDFDDTLIVSRTDRGERLIQALESFGCQVFHDKLSSSWGKSFYELVTSISPEVCENFDQFINHYSNLLQQYPPNPCPGVIDSIPILKNFGPLFVHSSSYSVLIRTDLESMGLLGSFEYVSGSDWHPEHKPHPDSLMPIFQLLSNKNVKPNQCFYIGDSDSDRKVAAAANCNFVGAGFTKEAFEKLRSVDVRPNLIAKSMTEVKNIIDSLC